MLSNGWYYRLSYFFKEYFGEKVYKVPIDVDLNCPNRDGTISSGGCIFCHIPGFSPSALRKEKSGGKEKIKNQVLSSQYKIEKVKEMEKEGFIPKKKYLAFFQSYTNTYGKISFLDSLYREALALPGIVGLSVATRPDCLSSEVLDLFEEYAKENHLWLELGIQSVHDKTLKRINRGHDYACFEEAVNKCKDRGFFVCAHIINGLPGETKEDMLETVKRLNELPLQGIKFHHLQIIKDTPLYRMYKKGEVKVIEAQEYLDILCDQLEILREDIVVHRLISDVTEKELLIAPKWRIHPGTYARLVDEELKSRESYQGKKFAEIK